MLSNAKIKLLFTSLIKILNEKQIRILFLIGKNFQEREHFKNFDKYFKQIKIPDMPEQIEEQYSKRLENCIGKNFDYDKLYSVYFKSARKWKNLSSK